MRTAKMWIGNLDGSRSGLVVASSKKRAREIVGASRGEFENHWVLQTGIEQGLEPETLYTRPIVGAKQSWQRGRCPLK